jgi:divalent metal cation (Fe/Co/Zn/Cd) transporter
MIHVAPAFELPPDKQACERRAKRLEWLTIGYLATAIVLVFLVLGSSQAMKAAWIEDLLSLLPPLAFLIAARVRKREPTEQFPWGYHRAVGVAYVFAALALLVMGSYLFLESAMKLVTAERPPIGGIEIFGHPIWLGWLMLPTLLYTGIPPVFLGRAKLPLAEELHDKVLYADAEMNRADWMTAGAAMLGVLGIGAGLWWTDAAAALVISVDIVRDGFKNVRAALGDLMDERASRYDGNEPHPLNDDVCRVLQDLPWVADVQARMREEGHVFHVEAFVVPAGGTVEAEALEDARDRLHDLDWKIHDAVVMPVTRLPRRDRRPARAATGAAS